MKTFEWKGRTYSYNAGTKNFTDQDGKVTRRGFLEYRELWRAFEYITGSTDDSSTPEKKAYCKRKLRKMLGIPPMNRPSSGGYVKPLRHEKPKKRETSEPPPRPEIDVMVRVEGNKIIINNKLTICVKPGADIQAVIQRYVNHEKRIAV